MTKNYIKPEVEIVAVHLEGAVLSGSAFGEATGEDATWGNQFNPWE
jgi:hypothetical protein